MEDKKLSEVQEGEFREALLEVFKKLFEEIKEEKGNEQSGQ